jgi:Domain of unknown function (DUF5069)
MATDFRDGKTFPRRGRLPLGDALWLARVFDKARAAANDTIYDYIYPCPMDKGVMERWGVTPEEFDAAVQTHTSDDAILEWLRSRTTPKQIETANQWLLTEKMENLERQDSEEGVTTSI